MDAGLVELGSITRVEVGRESANGGGLGGGSNVLVVNVGADEVEELLSGEVAERVGLSGVSLPSGLSLDLSNEFFSDGVLLGSSECGNSASNDELKHNYNYNLSILLNNLY